MSQQEWCACAELVEFLNMLLEVKTVLSKLLQASKVFESIVCP